MNQTRSIPEDQLDPVRTFRAEDINCAGEWIFTERLAHQRRQPIRPPAKVNRRRNQNPQAWFCRPCGRQSAASAAGYRTLSRTNLPVR